LTTTNEVRFQQERETQTLDWDGKGINGLQNPDLEERFPSPQAAERKEP
jgi:hypothetical protein